MHSTPPAISIPNKVSKLATELQPSEIIKLAGEIKSRMAEGAEIFNYTIGDFNPDLFAIPLALREAISRAYLDNQTNYPPSNGIVALREALANFIHKQEGLAYEADDFLVAAGGRPLIYAAFQAMLDPDEPAVFPVPSWNNNHYTTLTRGRQVALETKAEDMFMPTAAMIKPHVEEAGLIALCSPLNPTGTVFSETALLEICELIAAENRRREGKKKPLYLIYDQIYWQLCHGKTRHIDPVSLLPEMRKYTIFIDGISKAYAATGIRVGWAFGPREIMNKMKSILGHVGAWAPKPEQVGTATFLCDESATAAFVGAFKTKIQERLQALYAGFQEMKIAGMPVDVVAPQAAIYLTVKIDLAGRKAPDGSVLESVAQTTAYILDRAGLALVPFSAFGASQDSPWYRLSVGTVKMEEIPRVFDALKNAIAPFK